MDNPTILTVDTLGRKFVKMGDKFMFLTHALGEGTELWATENEACQMGLVTMYNLSIGKGGVGCGYLFHTTYTSTHATNFLTVYRSRLMTRKVQDFLAEADSSPLLLRYRPPMLRIFTMGNDLVVIGSDLKDRMKEKLESQD